MMPWRGGHRRLLRAQTFVIIWCLWLWASLSYLFCNKIVVIVTVRQLSPSLINNVHPWNGLCQFLCGTSLSIITIPGQLCPSLMWVSLEGFNVAVIWCALVNASGTTKKGEEELNFNTAKTSLPSNTMPGGRGRLPAAVLNTCDHCKIVHDQSFVCFGK